MSYQQTLSPVGSLLRPLEGRDIGDTSREDAENAPELFPATGPTAANTGARSHQIVDGDTLTRLAAEYLGSSERYLEIYALNRDILTKPDLLPIGKTLKIPSNDSPPEAAVGRKESGHSGAAAPKLVPIPPGALRRAND